MNFNIKHRYKNQTHLYHLKCYGTRTKIPKHIVISVYTVLAFCVPVIIPVFGVFILNKYLPKHIRH